MGCAKWKGTLWHILPILSYWYFWIIRQLVLIRNRTIAKIQLLKGQKLPIKFRFRMTAAILLTFEHALRYSWRLPWPTQISIIFIPPKLVIKRSSCAKFYVDWPSRFRDTIDQSFVSRYGFCGKNEENNRVSWGLWFSNNLIPVVILTVFAPQCPLS